MALVLTEPGSAGATKIYGVVRIHADPDLERAEFAILVWHELGGRGLGTLMMQRIIAYARNARQSARCSVTCCARTAGCWRYAANWVSRVRRNSNDSTYVTVVLALR